MTGSETADAVVVEHREATAILRLGSPGEKTIILTPARMASLQRALESLARKTELKGLIITGQPQSGFCAGADIAAIKSVTDPARGETLAREGQQIFGRIAALSCPTVAAISGACVGGGYELALACSYRIALDQDETKIGLPEVKLGILPGFGGTQRLARLVGLTRALDVILKGKVVGAQDAYRYGMVDALCPAVAGDAMKSFAELETLALQVVSGAKPLRRRGTSLGERLLSSTGIGRRMVHRRAKEAVLKETRGHYPAPLRALDVTVEGLGMKLDEALKTEARALGELIATPVSKSLVHLYYLSENASKLGKSARREVEQAKIGVIGAGVMGAGIASAFLTKGLPVVVVEVNADARQRGEAHVRRSVESRRWLSDEQRERLLANIRFAAELEALRDCSLVIEAIVEDMNAKRSVFGKLEAIVSPQAILASNTSSLSIEEIASAVAAPQRVIGMHYFNPAEKMPLVELVLASATSERTIAHTAALTSRLGKYPVVVENVPGFLVNRILSPYIAEAGTLVAEGVPIEVIDKAALDFGMPMGPMRLLDEVGLDVAAKVQQVMEAAYGARMQAPDILARMVKEGRLGKKSGAGFYRYGGSSATDETVDPEIYGLLGVKSKRDAELATIGDRLVLSLVNEAVLALDEGVAGRPGPEAAGQVDLATVMGMGFPPFRGGVVRYAERLGPRALQMRLDGLAKHHGMRFAAVDGIRRRAQGGGSFYAPAP